MARSLAFILQLREWGCDLRIHNTRSGSFSWLMIDDPLGQYSDNWWMDFVHHHQKELWLLVASEARRQG